MTNHKATIKFPLNWGDFGFIELEIDVEFNITDEGLGDGEFWGAKYTHVSHYANLLNYEISEADQKYWGNEIRMMISLRYITDDLIEQYLNEQIDVYDYSDYQDEEYEPEID